MKTKKGAMMKRRRSILKTKEKESANKMKDLMDPIGLNLLNAGASSTPSAHVRATVAPTTRMMQTLKPGFRKCGLARKGADAPYAALYNPVEDDDASRR